MEVDKRYFETAASWQHVVECSERQAEDLLETKLGCDSGRTIYRIIRGSRCETAKRLFREFAKVLEFPSYFGRNWSALDECLGDLEWLPAGRYVLVITNAERILVRELHGRSTFFGVLANAHDELEAPTGYDPCPRELAKLHVVLHFEPGALASEVERLRFAGFAGANATRALGLS